MKLPGFLFELVIWIAALLALGTADSHEQHLSLCPLARAGFDWCYGCGLGRAIICILSGQWLTSFEYHWFGFPALMILLHRIYRLSIKSFVYFAH